MAGGGKGGSQTTEVKIPEWLEQAAQRNIAKGEELARIGYTPYFGPDVAAMTPGQIQGMQATNDAANAFGMGTTDPMAGMPQTQTFAGGVQGYSSGPMFQQAVDQLRQDRPGQYDALMAPFIDPITGAQPSSPYGNGGAAGGMGSGKGGIGSNMSGLPMGGGGSSDGMWSDGMTASEVRSHQAAGMFGASPAGGRGGTRSINTPMSYAPGGVNTRNPGSIGNSFVAGLSGPQGAPTAANRPVSRPAR